jgi:hypothetical protein
MGGHDHAEQWHFAKDQTPHTPLGVRSVGPGSNQYTSCSLISSQLSCLQGDTDSPNAKRSSVGIADTGVDTGNCMFYDPVNPVGSSHRKVVAYLAAGGSTTSDRDGLHGHGTHVVLLPSSPFSALS